MKVVINVCYGGFNLSDTGQRYLLQHGFTGATWDIDRHDPLLVACVEELGETSYDPGLSKLKIVEIPDDTRYCIRDYDGKETIIEVGHLWE